MELAIDRTRRHLPNPQCRLLNYFVVNYVDKMEFEFAPLQDSSERVYQQTLESCFW